MIKKLVLISFIIVATTLNSQITISAEESKQVIQILEQRKMARDLYYKLYKTWHSDTFKRLSDSEQIYLNSLKKLTTKLNIIDPTIDDTKGVFSSDYITKLYIDFSKIGLSSDYEAFRIAATVQDLMINDINQLLNSSSDKSIIDAMNNTKQGSISHLRACNREIKKFGMTYQAQFLSTEELRAILPN